MFKARNLSVLLAITVALFVLCSSVSTVPAARSFLDGFSRDQNGKMCPTVSCDSHDHCKLFAATYGYTCNCKLNISFHSSSI